MLESKDKDKSVFKGIVGSSGEKYGVYESRRVCGKEKMFIK